MQDRGFRAGGIQVRSVGSEEEHRGAGIRVRHVTEAGVHADQHTAAGDDRRSLAEGGPADEVDQGSLRCGELRDTHQNPIRGRSVSRPPEEHHAEARPLPDPVDQGRPAVFEPMLVVAGGERARRHEPRSQSSVPDDPVGHGGLGRAARDAHREGTRLQPEHRGQMGVLGPDLAPVSPTLDNVRHQHARPLPGAQPDPDRRPREKCEPTALEQPLRIDCDIEAALPQPPYECADGPCQGPPPPRAKHAPPGCALPDDHLVEVRIVADHVGGALLGRPRDVGVGVPAAQSPGQWRREDQVPPGRQPHDEEPGAVSRNHDWKVMIGDPPHNSPHAPSP